MPPEPLPWDRKEFYKERKHERPDTPSFGSNHPRWRDYSSSSSNHYAPYHRWGGGGSSNDFRRPPGHGKQGGWHMFGEESGHMYAPYRYNDRIIGDENFRPSVSRGDGRYSRNSRDNRGSFGPKDWRSHSWEMSNGSSNAPGRLHDVSNDQRPVGAMHGCPPSHPPHSDFINTWDQIQMKDHHDNNKMAGVNDLGTGPKGDKESNLEWRPVKWARSGSMGSRGSGFSHSSSSKSFGGMDSNEEKTELQKKNTTAVHSPSGDIAACVTSRVTSEEMMSRKKPRLGWGEGLAKYEKKKVEGPDISPNKDGMVVCASSVEVNHLQSLNLSVKSPTVNGFSERLSPATPSSVACSSSPGVEEKTPGKSVNVDTDASNLCASPSIGSLLIPERLPFNLENMDASFIANLGSSIAELLQFDDPSALDSSFLRYSAMNKLLIWKADISKALEVTESEIDLLENELKSMKFEYGSRLSRPDASGSFPEETNVKTCNELEVGFDSISIPSSLQVISCEDEIVEKASTYNGTLEGTHADKGYDIDSPGTATSKPTKSVLPMKTVSISDVENCGECFGDLGTVHSTPTELKSSLSCVDKEEIITSSSVDDKPLTEIHGHALSLTGNGGHENGEDNLCNLILISNKESAARAAEAFNILLPRDQCKIDFDQFTSLSTWWNDTSMKEKFAMRKWFLKFRERIVTLKFKAFQHLWKEDMRLLSVRKYRARSQKKYEASFRITHCGYQKHRSSIRSRFASPAGNASLVPMAEILKFTSKLLSDSQVKNYRRVLKMPALILDEKERIASRFVSSNGLVEDPCALENERAMINPWTSEEREIFMDKLATFGKDFRKIAAFLDHKSTADCVEFYYKNHKSESFEKTKIKQAKSSTNYLMASNKKWNRDMNAASLDILGAASVMAADADNDMGGQRLCSSRIYFDGYRDLKTAGSDNTLERPAHYDTFGNEKETAAADVLAGICGSVSSEAISSCITTSVDLLEGYRARKYQNVDYLKRPSTSDVTENVDEDTCSDESCGEMGPSDWTDKEKSIFIQAVSSYGKDFAMISQCVGTRSRDQCKVFFSKARKCLGLDMLHPGSASSGLPVNDDANGGGSDMKDASAIETGQATCNGKLHCEVDEGLSLPVLNPNHNELEDDEKINLHTNLNKSADNGVSEMLMQKDSKMADTSVSDACQENHRPELTFDVSSQIANSVEVQKISFSSVRNQATEEETVAESVGARNIVDAATSDANGIRDHLEESKLLVPDNGSSNQRSVMQDSDASRNVVTTKLDYLKKPSVELLSHENDSAGLNSVTDTADIVIEKDNQDRSSSTLDFQESADKQGDRDDYFQHLSGHPLSRNKDSTQILRGYPLQMPTKKEMNGDISCKPLSEIRNFPNLGTHAASQFLAQDGFLQKCDSSKAQCSMPELPKDHSQSMPTIEKPGRNGDVKLFGKILNNPSPVQSTSNELDERVANPSKPSSKSCLKYTGHHCADGNTTHLKGDHENFLGHENGPMRSYSLWDGKRIQTGYSSFPDSTYLLAKYPAAFSNYHGSSSKMQHQAFQNVVKGNDCNLNGISVFPPREICSSNGVVDYQMYRGHEGSKVQPFTLDTKQHSDDAFSEMQRLNGPQGKSMVGINVVGRGGIVVGGPCGGVSDPVAAITMHFAKNGGQSGGIIREEESWRSKGDIDR